MKKYPRTLLLLQALLVIFAAPDADALRKDRHEAERAKPRAEQELNRVRQIMLPLLQATDHRTALEDIRLTVVDEAKINAASGGNGQFYVTTGLLRQATEEQLRGVLAHEIAHEDLGHPPKRRSSAWVSAWAQLCWKKYFPAVAPSHPLPEQWSPATIAGQWNWPPTATPSSCSSAPVIQSTPWSIPSPG